MLGIHLGSHHRPSGHLSTTVPTELFQQITLIFILLSQITKIFLPDYDNVKVLKKLVAM